MRDALIRIALGREGLRFDSSGFINELALAKALGVRASTVRRLLRPEREPQRYTEYTPTGAMLRGLMRLTGAASEGDALDYCRNQPSVSPADLKLFIRPDGPPKRRAHRKKLS